MCRMDFWTPFKRTNALFYTSPFRFEHREENRKDCLRTLFSIIEEAGKARKMAESARVSYVKDRLRSNPMFMERLQAKTKRSQGSDPGAA